MGESAARQAVEAASRSCAVAAPPLAERRTWLAGIARALTGHRDELARIITLEQGKPLKESLVEVDYAAEFFRFYADHHEPLEARTLAEFTEPQTVAVHQAPNRESTHA